MKAGGPELGRWLLDAEAVVGKTAWVPNVSVLQNLSRPGSPLWPPWCVGFPVTVLTLGVAVTTYPVTYSLD